MLTDSAGVVTDSYAYDAFGNLSGRTGGTGNVYLYAGEQRDGNVGFYYLRARYLNIQSGRFVTLDTFLGSVYDPPTLHKYTYASSDPVNGIDPTGHWKLPELMVATAVRGFIYLMQRPGLAMAVSVLASVGEALLPIEAQIALANMGLPSPARLGPAMADETLSLLRFLKSPETRKAFTAASKRLEGKVANLTGHEFAKWVQKYLMPSAVNIDDVVKSGKAGRRGDLLHLPGRLLVEVFSGKTLQGRKREQLVELASQAREFGGGLLYAEVSCFLYPITDTSVYKRRRIDGAY